MLYFTTSHPGLLFCHLPEPDTVQRGLVAASARSDAFFFSWRQTATRGVQRSVSRGFPVQRRRRLFIPQEHNVENLNSIANVLHNTMFSVPQRALWSLPRLALTWRTPVHTNLIILFVVKQESVVLLHIHIWRSDRMISGNSALFGLFLHNSLSLTLSPFISWYNLDCQGASGVGSLESVGKIYEGRVKRSFLGLGWVSTKYKITKFKNKWLNK